MKKIILSMAIGLGGVSVYPVMAAVPVIPSATLSSKVFSADTMAQHTLPDLSFAQLLNKFYSKRLPNTTVAYDKDAFMPEVRLTSSNKGVETLAVMHPVINYTSIDGEPRYLIMIEEVWRHAPEEHLSYCKNCQASLDLYSFKQLDNGSYQLVSRTPEEAKFLGGWGRINFEAESVQINMQPLGKTLMGSIFKAGSHDAMGSAYWWQMLHLFEDDYIQEGYFDPASGDNHGRFGGKSALSYNFTSSYEVQPNHATYYPIKLTYTGHKPVNGGVEMVNLDQIITFNPTIGRYE